ncbi:MAG: hypothetical protein K0V04_35790 [Deltaproteobacteria bacterium]|nr:hypothetical protein [Deltaproteobacteria bacterium]
MFDELATLLRKLQLRHELSVYRNADDEEGLMIALTPSGTTGRSPDAEDARRLLGVERSHDLAISRMVRDRRPDVIAIHGRSVLDAMFYLAKGVEGADDQAGTDLCASNPRARVLLHIRQWRRPPKGAHVVVRHDDRYFYIEQSDRESKRTFAFLILLNLTSASPEGGLVVTGGAGG